LNPAFKDVRKTKRNYAMKKLFQCPLKSVESMLMASGKCLQNITIYKAVSKRNGLS